MTSDEVLRVVVVRKGKFRPVEFRLRPGEIGLSLFRRSPGTHPDAILAAVHSAGKRGELGIAEIPISVFTSLGLKLVVTPGKTSDPRVNRLHVEARYSRWRSFVLKLRSKPIHDAFNEEFAPKLAAVAVLLENPSEP